ncbi:MAG: metallophosphoesterase [Synergistaceae bacterium]|nr:metallophosphoesterase [Synergistaceae bacterium]
MNNKTYEKRFSEHYGFWLIWGLTLLAIHLFIYLRIRTAIGVGLRSFIWLSFSIVMMGVQLLSRRTKKIRHGIQRKWIDRICSVWTLFVLISFIILIILDLIKHLTGIGLPSGHDLLLSFALSAAVLIFGVKQANTVQTTVMKVPTSKLPEGCDRLRIVQLTDLHLGPFTGIPLLAQILRKVRSTGPDIVVVTGDIADGRLKGRRRETAMLSRIKPKFGVYAVTGNHDYYDDIDEAVAFMESAGMRVLRSEGIEAGGILIVGAEDRDHLIKEQWNLTRSETLVLSFERKQKEKFLLLLRHRPIVEAGTEGHFDLQLSGHTHGGQIFPLISSRHKIVGHPRGLKKLKCGGLLYVSNGAGFVGPPVRLMAPPEIAVFDLVREKTPD